MKKLLLLPFLFSVFFVFAQKHQLIPYPKLVEEKSDYFVLDQDLHFVLSGKVNSSVKNYFSRMVSRMANRTALFFKHPHIVENRFIFKSRIEVRVLDSIIFPSKNMDESYTLVINEKGAKIEGSAIGCYRAMETLLQLITVNEGKYSLPFVEISDSPRFPWRGLMLDACRHFLPVEVIKRNLDAMATAKMNVFHWHLTDDQGFRIESKEFPLLHILGSNGDYYTQNQVKEIIQYATQRGIRVVPEFDIPGHATAYCVAYPQFCSKNQEYDIERKFGIFDPTLNPTDEAVYAFLEKFLGEMADLFPDEYLHIGGDENNGKHWTENEQIQDFKKENNLKDNYELQAYFNRRVLKILQQQGKKMMGWDEIFHPEIPREITIQSWQGKASLYEAAKAGYPGVLSHGYYLDMAYHAETYYANDPLPDTHDLTPAQEKLILGGEAPMWAELVSDETVDSRIWPVALAVAERLWSPREVNDVESMYRRKNTVSQQLEEHGLTHLKNQSMLFSRLCNYQKHDKSLYFVRLLEPLKGYERHRYIRFETTYPLSRLADVCYTESEESREWMALFSDYKQGKAPKQSIEELLQELSQAAQEYLQLAENAPAMAEGSGLANDAVDLCKAAQAHLKKPTKETKKNLTQQITQAKDRKMDCYLAVVKAFELLVE